MSYLRVSLATRHLKSCHISDEIYNVFLSAHRSDHPYTPLHICLYGLCKLGNTAIMASLFLCIGF